MQCQPNSEEKRLDFWVKKVDLLHYFWEIDLEKNRLFQLGPAPMKIEIEFTITAFMHQAFEQGTKAVLTGKNIYQGKNLSG